MTQPLVSVIVPVHDGAQFLGDALRSALDQRYEPVEVIVVDDASSDASHDVARSFPGVRTVRLTVQHGPAGARNAGIEAAEGEYIAFLDADDVMRPDRLAVQVGHLLRNPRVGAVLVKQDVFLGPGVEPPSWLKANPEMLGDGGFLPISVVLSAELLRRIGGFDPAYRMSEDMELLFRLQRSGVVVDKLEDVLVGRRIHGANLTYQTGPMQRYLLRAVRAGMVRGRP